MVTLMFLSFIAYGFSSKAVRGLDSRALGDKPQSRLLSPSAIEGSKFAWCMSGSICPQRAAKLRNIFDAAVFPQEASERSGQR